MATKPKTAALTVLMPVKKLLTMAAPYNPREMLEHDYDQLKHSLTTFGQTENLVINRRSAKAGWKKGSTPVIVSGHQRARAAADLELEELEVKWVDLDEVGERSLNLIHNRTAGDFEEDMLERALREIEELGGGGALDFTGFTEDELAHYLGDPGTIAGEGDDFNEPNTETNHECPKCGFKWNE